MLLNALKLFSEKIPSVHFILIHGGLRVHQIVSFVGNIWLKTFPFCKNKCESIKVTIFQIEDLQKNSIRQLTGIQVIFQRARF